MSLLLPRIGVDMVFIPRFEESLKRSGKNFRSRIFHQSELKGQRVETLAGIFAGKEAAIKALSLEPESWLDLMLSHEKNGEPKIIFPSGKNLRLQISISHEENYAIATVLVMKK